jgi:chromate transporter
MQNLTFLKDVFICSLGAFGGPAAHYGVFTDQLVVKKQYVSEEELIELVALNSVLPGPTSTQTIVSIGYKQGGPKLALLTLMVWALPVIVMMTLLSFIYKALDLFHISSDGLRFIGPMAVGFIIVAAYRIGRKVVHDKLTLLLLLFGGMTTYLIRSPWIFPLVLIIGGGVSIATSSEKHIWNHVRLSPPWRYFMAFLSFAGGSLALKHWLPTTLTDLFESFYRYGYLVFGGGQVVIPVMHTELVQLKTYMTNEAFLTGYGLVQGLPGPMFSFSAFAGGLAASGQNVMHQILGALLSAIGIFLPGLLLIFFVYPVWENLKEIKALRIAIRGINAVAGGLITASAVILMQKSGLSLEHLVVTLFSVAVIFSKKIPAPVLVLIVITAGFII